MHKSNFFPKKHESSQHNVLCWSSYWYEKHLNNTSDWRQD